MIDLSILTATVRMAAPLLLAGTGALYNDRAGTTNITLEGTMLISCFFSVTCSYYTSNWVIATFAGILSGIIVAIIFYLFTTVLGGDELVVGFSMNILLDGLSLFLLKQIFHQSGSLVSPKIQGLPSINAGFIAKIPIIGNIFHQQTWLVPFSIFAALATWIIFYRTPFGLRIVSCGEHPQAALTVGIDVYKVRFKCNLISGAMCGLAGVQISLGFLSLFTQGMTVGKGFIALASVIFSRGNPLRLIWITMVFGFSEALSNKVQLMKLPSELVLMIPYMAVLILTVFISKHLKNKKPTN